MITSKLQNALNEQINAEFYSAYLYLSMAAYFESMSLQGFANWMRAQAQEELAHAMKFYDFINQRDGRVTLKQIAQPPADWDSAITALKTVHEHEQNITQLINKLVNLAAAQKDHATYAFLQWFVNEQVEEQQKTSDIVGKLKLLNDTPAGLYMIDAEIHRRVFTPVAEQQAP
ncbi:MAG TPA: ferritin [Sedimentisphaerales bacterium]|nr:ferritin [Sedimentisphaerales bacterium]